MSGARRAGGDAGRVAGRPGAGEPPSRRCSRVHHPPRVGRSGGRPVEVADPPVERWAARVAAEHGFADVAHQLEVLGTCAACAAAQR